MRCISEYAGKPKQQMRRRARRRRPRPHLLPDLKQSRTEGNYTRIEHEADKQQSNTMPRSKKDIQVIKEVKRALDAALADGVISKDAHALIDSPGL